MFSWILSWFFDSPRRQKSSHRERSRERSRPPKRTDHETYTSKNPAELPGSSPPRNPDAVIREPFSPHKGNPYRRNSRYRPSSPRTSDPIRRPRAWGNHPRPAEMALERIHQEPPHEEPQPNESIIAVFGMTGTGKTSFINKLVGNKLEVGHNLRSMTSAVTSVKARLNGRVVVLVDTPGFDDTTRTDAEVLSFIASWLATSYDKNAKLTGIIYLHRISDNRMSGSSYRNLAMFRSLCGMRILSNVILATTMWDRVTMSEGNTRERDLLMENSFWGDMKRAGATVRRYDGTRGGAASLVNELIDKRPVTMQIQHEMVIEKKKLSDTEAGRSMWARLDEMAADYQEGLQRIKRDLQQAMKEKDELLLEEIKQSRIQLEQKIKENHKSREYLERPINKVGWGRWYHKCLGCKRPLKCRRGREIWSGACPYCKKLQTFIR